jgi:hypothetical protein
VHSPVASIFVRPIGKGSPIQRALHAKGDFDQAGRTPRGSVPRAREELERCILLDDSEAAAHASRRSRRAAAAQQADPLSRLRGPDSRGMFDFLAADIDWEVRPHLPDAGRYQGHDGVRRLSPRFDEVTDHWWHRPEEFVPVGGDQVVVPLTWGGRGKGSSLNFEGAAGNLGPFRARRQDRSDFQRALTGPSERRGLDLRRSRPGPGFVEEQH